MAVIDNPILNSAFAQPGRHWLLDDKGIPTGIVAGGRRRSEFVVPVPPARLLQHWRAPDRGRRLFVCQIEAVETAIWLAEVAPRTESERLRTRTRSFNLLAAEVRTEERG